MTPTELKAWARDPLGWATYFWPTMMLDKHQAAILQSVADVPETLCHTGNTLGKTRSAALSVLWFITTRFPARIIASSSSTKQLEIALWPEVTKLIRNAVVPLGLHVKHRNLRVMDPVTKRPYDDHFAKFFTTNDVENFQGVHENADIPRVFVLFDEASLIADEFYDGAVSFADRILGIGNPLSTTNWFYHFCQRGDLADPDDPTKLFRKVIHVDADDTANIKAGRKWAKAGGKGTPPQPIPGMLSWSKYRHHVATREPLWKLQRLHGKFDTSGKSMMFPADWLDRCEEMYEVATELARGPFGLGVDVAEGGRDFSCWALVDRFGLFQIKVMDTPNTAVIVPETLKIMDEYNVSPGRVAFDRGAGGKQYADLLRNQGYMVRAIAFGGAAVDSKTYKNCRAEMYWRLRQAMDQNRWSKIVDAEGRDVHERFFSIPLREHQLREELTCLPIQDDQGRLLIMRKDPQAELESTKYQGYTRPIPRQGRRGCARQLRYLRPRPAAPGSKAVPN